MPARPTIEVAAPSGDEERLDALRREAEGADGRPGDQAADDRIDP